MEQQIKTVTHVGTVGIYRLEEKSLSACLIMDSGHLPKLMAPKNLRNVVKDVNNVIPIREIAPGANQTSLKVQITKQKTVHVPADLNGTG
jgi:hypothetical protein